MLAQEFWDAAEDIVYFGQTALIASPRYHLVQRGLHGSAAINDMPAFEMIHGRSNLLKQLHDLHDAVANGRLVLLQVHDKSCTPKPIRLDGIGSSHAVLSHPTILLSLPMTTIRTRASIQTGGENTYNSLVLQAAFKTRSDHSTTSELLRRATPPFTDDGVTTPLLRSWYATSGALDAANCMRAAVDQCDNVQICMDSNVGFRSQANYVGAPR
ncbi:hypothetical protein KC358_g28 [Hortaea werneckii]|nr:hypothetical protein KC358_g28 [Hortaea werneckii]